MHPESVCILIERSDGKILATSRRCRPTEWGLPGGKLDLGETHIEAALRELQEETGLEIESDDLEFVANMDCGPGKDGRTFFTTAFMFKGSTDCLTPEKLEEGIEVDWVTREDLIAGPFKDYNTELFDIVFEKEEQA